MSSTDEETNRHSYIKLHGGEMEYGVEDIEEGVSMRSSMDAEGFTFVQNYEESYYKIRLDGKFAIVEYISGEDKSASLTIEGGKISLSTTGTVHTKCLNANINAAKKVSLDANMVVMDSSNINAKVGGDLMIFSGGDMETKYAKIGSDNDIDIIVAEIREEGRDADITIASYEGLGISVGGSFEVDSSLDLAAKDYVLVIGQGNTFKSEMENNKTKATIGKLNVQGGTVRIDGERTTIGGSSPKISYFVKKNGKWTIKNN